MVCNNSPWYVAAGRMGAKGGSGGAGRSGVWRNFAWCPMGPGRIRLVGASPACFRLLVKTYRKYTHCRTSPSGNSPQACPGRWGAVLLHGFDAMPFSCFPGVASRPRAGDWLRRFANQRPNTHHFGRVCARKRGLRPVARVGRSRSAKFLLLFSLVHVFLNLLSELSAAVTGDVRGRAFLCRN